LKIQGVKLNSILNFYNDKIYRELIFLGLHINLFMLYNVMFLFRFHLVRDSLFPIEYQHISNISGLKRDFNCSITSCINREYFNIFRIFIIRIMIVWMRFSLSFCSIFFDTSVKSIRIRWLKWLKTYLIIIILFTFENLQLVELLNHFHYRSIIWI